MTDPLEPARHRLDKGGQEKESRRKGPKGEGRKPILGIWMRGYAKLRLRRLLLVVSDSYIEGDTIRGFEPSRWTS